MKPMKHTRLHFFTLSLLLLPAMSMQAKDQDAVAQYVPTESNIAAREASGRIGKELKIHRALSRTCLYSSWFDVEKREDVFILNGLGWGHGVGLCQLDAAEMAPEGISILQKILKYNFAENQNYLLFYLQINKM